MSSLSFFSPFSNHFLELFSPRTLVDCPPAENRFIASDSSAHSLKVNPGPKLHSPSASPCSFASWLHENELFLLYLTLLVLVLWPIFFRSSFWRRVVREEKALRMCWGRFFWERPVRELAK